LLGALSLLWAFQATSSNVKIIKRENKETAICVDGRGILVTSPDMLAFRPIGPCPEWPNARPAAVVNFENPLLVTLGVTLTLLGFLMQILAVPGAKSITLMHHELKVQRRLNRERERQKASNQ
jgi:hypothetical protein